MVDGNGVAYITDFGIASVAMEALSGYSSDANSYFGTRWMGPELIARHPHSPGCAGVTKMSDVYAFSMVIIEVRGFSKLSQNFLKIFLDLHWESSLLRVQKAACHQGCTCRPAASKT